MFDSASGECSTPQRDGFHKEVVIAPRERIISEKSDLFMLRWLGKHNYTLNMFHDECEDCSIIAMVPREMDN